MEDDDYSKKCRFLYRAEAIFFIIRHLLYPEDGDYWKSRHMVEIEKGSFYKIQGLLLIEAGDNSKIHHLLHRADVLSFIFWSLLYSEYGIFFRKNPIADPRHNSP